MKNGVKGGMEDGSPGVAVVVKSNPRFLDENEEITTLPKSGF